VNAFMGTGNLKPLLLWQYLEFKPMLLKGYITSLSHSAGLHLDRHYLI
jgi:hypothetical protein